MCHNDSEKWFYVCRILALMWDNFWNFGAPKKHLKWELGNIHYLLFICNTFSLRKQKYNRKYFFTSKLNQIWVFIFSQIFIKNDDVTKKSHDLAPYFKDFLKVLKVGNFTLLLSPKSYSRLILRLHQSKLLRIHESSY